MNVQIWYETVYGAVTNEFQEPASSKYAAIPEWAVQCYYLSPSDSALYNLH